MNRQDSGAAMFARYAYPPNELGYCGPTESAPLLDATRRAGESTTEMSELARQFDGAWCYLETLADGTGTGNGDPLDLQVVEAYWLGNGLLEQLGAATFAHAVTTHFADQHGARLTGLATAANPTGMARAHHGFHVFEVYPWTGLLHVGAGQPALSILEQCRIRWGQVLDVSGDHARVRSRPLAWDGHRLSLGAPRVEQPRWAHRGHSLLPAPPHDGSWVAMHWSWICDLLSTRQLVHLRNQTADQLRLTNSTVPSENGNSGQPSTTEVMPH